MRSAIIATTVGLGLILVMSSTLTTIRDDSIGPSSTVVSQMAATSSCNQRPINDVRTSKMDNLEEEAADWGIFCESSPNTNIFATPILTDAVAPSLDGKSLRCGIVGIGGDNGYANIHCFRELELEPQADVLTLTMPFLFASTNANVNVCNNQDGKASVVQALEFTMSKWHHSQRFEFALQWENVVGGDGPPQWRYWDPHQPEQWVPISTTITPCLEAGKWYTITLSGEITGGRVHYQRFSLTGEDNNQETQELGIFVVPVCDNTPERFAVAVQLDGNATEDPYDVYIDNVSFKRQATLQTPIFLQVCYIYLPVIVK